MAKTPKKSKGEHPGFDMYHVFRRWDFALLVLFVLITLILTVIILIRGDQVV
jgi:hypothetical protein